MPVSRYEPPLVTSPRIEHRRIPAGYPGTEQTTVHVGRLIREGARDFYVRQKAIDILFERAVEPKNYLGEIGALFNWVQQNVRYTKDPFQVEVLHSARRMLELRAGDCDDMTILLGALVKSVGHPVRIVITGPDPAQPRLFSHIYLEANHRGEWIPLDATMPYPMGWSPRALVKQVVPIEEEPKHVIPGSRRSGRVAAAVAGLASRVAARDCAPGRAGARPAREVPVGTVASAAVALAEPMAPPAASLRVAEGAGGASAAPHQSSDPRPAAELGAAPGERRGTRGDRSAAGAAGRCAAPSPAAAGERAPGGSRAAGGARTAGTLSGYLRSGRALYRRFNCFAPASIDRLPHDRVIPPVVVQLGRLVGLVYRSDKWNRGRPRSYIHFMQDAPRLVSDVAGRRLFIVGGNYRVTSRGIVG